jgi:cation transporter-like permease
MSLEQAEAKLEDIQSLNIVVPVDARHTAEEWNAIMGARVPSPEHISGSKNDSEHQAGEII